MQSEHQSPKCVTYRVSTRPRNTEVNSADPESSGPWLEPIFRKISKQYRSVMKCDGFKRKIYWIVCLFFFFFFFLNMFDPSRHGLTSFTSCSWLLILLFLYNIYIKEASRCSGSGALFRWGVIATKKLFKFWNYLQIKIEKNNEDERKSIVLLEAVFEWFLSALNIRATAAENWL